MQYSSNNIYHGMSILSSDSAIFMFPTMIPLVKWNHLQSFVFDALLSKLGIREMILFFNQFF